MPLKIGLTGGIASGKSLTAKIFFSIYNIPIIDADVISHELMLPNTVYYQKIVDHFGLKIINSQKFIDRKKLRTIVFNNKKERYWLEDFMHKEIFNIMQNRVENLNYNKYCIMVIPLLFETKYSISIDRILLVDCSKRLQIMRICSRDKNTLVQAENILSFQSTRYFRIRHSDDIIYNNGSVKKLSKMIKKLHFYYSKIA